MLILNLAYDVLPNRQVTIQLPITVQPGRHELIIVLDKANANEAVAETNINRVMQFSGAASAFAAVNGMAYQNKVRAE